MSRKWGTALLIGILAGSGAVAFAESASPGGVMGRRTTGSGLQDLAGRLNARERAIERRERSLEDREEDLRAQEEALLERLTDLEAVRDQLDERLASLSEIEENRRVAMTEMVEKMRPKQAATFMAALDQPLAVDLLERMQTGKSGKALAAMNPDDAAKLVEALAAPITLEQP